MRIGGVCVSWKVIAGLAAVGVGVWAFAPHLVAGIPILAFAICPLSMLLMMRGMSGRAHDSGREAANRASAVGAADDGLDDLKARLAGLRNEEETIAREVARLEAANDDGGSPPHGLEAPAAPPVE